MSFLLVSKRIVWALAVCVVGGVVGGMVGCGSPDVGNGGRVVGGACDAYHPCAPEARCLTGGDFPFGTCAVPCGDDRHCPLGTACINKEGGVCLLLCQFPTDCRLEYKCKAKGRAGAPGEALVCIE